MSGDDSLVFVVLFVGGALFLGIFLWITATCVRASDANEPPAELHH
jgi:hypothetical protein